MLKLLSKYNALKLRIGIKEKMKCDLCDYTHSRKSFVGTHFNRVHQKIKHLVCDKCEYATVNERSLFFHKKSVHDKIFEKCEQCSYKSVRKADLITHIECVHEKIRRFKCDKCTYEASSKDSLSKHIKKYHEKYFEFKCDQCTYVTVRRADLTTHLKRHKTEVCEKIDNEKFLRTFKCDKCAYQSSRKYCLSKHIQKHHEKYFEFKCDQCTYVTVRRQDLSRHLKRHKTEVFKENEKIDNEKILLKSSQNYQYNCVEAKCCDADKCAYQSSRKYCLSKHIQKYHDKYFEFKCDQCTYVTVRRQDLSMHLKRHETEVFKENEKIDNEKILLKSSQNYQDNCAEAKCCDVENKHICRCCSHHAEEEGKFTLKDLKKHLKKEHILTYNDYVNYILVHF